ncbi:mannitol dehydrogenase family protein [Streptomyces galbus]|uniref:Mannitol-1-phosphate 5-dehydrogenase n=1 Tax=Streptomyces galbus TaxID=33898 RepID=A0A4V6XZ92_STRGB|nr:mannitol dehydrogenase family protein [Streptomyces galbus]TKS97002.1 mannitol dehydrogenase family protein [Streptomyces galbus]GHD51206.1 mannitol 2-dehydrogenase [Streptomyces galbus]
MSDSPPVPALNNRSLDACPGSQLETPGYDRARIEPAVVHFGVGGFHRAHQAVYFDQLAELGFTRWGVVGVGMRRPEMGEVLDAQDNLFTVVQRGGDDSTAKVIGSMVEYFLLTEDRAEVARRLADPRTRLVTLTITADGYVLPDDAGESGDSVFGLIVDALDQRRRDQRAPFTVLSCDNLPDSAAATREAVMSLAGRRDPALARWIEERVSFPGSMVDRITPATTPGDRDEVEDDFQVGDRWPVITEPFTQWVIEDDFCNDRPPLDRVGALFVGDVAPYKLIKSRLLNGVHSALGYVGHLAGHRSTDEAMADPVVADFVERLMREEIAPLLPADVPGMDLDAYCDSVLERLHNPSIGDRLARLCRRGSTKMPDYLLPSLHDAHAGDRPRTRLAFAVAAWMRYLRGVDLDGAAIDVQDARADELREAALRGGDDPGPLLAYTDVFGDLADDTDSVAVLRASLAGSFGNGESLRAALASPPEPSRRSATPSTAGAS